MEGISDWSGPDDYYTKKLESLPRKLPTKIQRSQNHLIRGYAKKHAHTWHKDSFRIPLTPIVDLQGLPADQRRPVLERALRSSSTFHLMGKRSSFGTRHVRVVRRMDEIEEEEDLARSNVPLPGEGSGVGALPRRCPSFERQDAFRDETTSKRRSERGVWMCDASEDAEVAKLYEMGLLYDGGEDNDEGVAARVKKDYQEDVFNLGSIRHPDTPLYSIRASKRLRRSKSQREQSESDNYDHSSQSQDKSRRHSPLRLELSFSEIGTEEWINGLIEASREASEGGSEGDVPMNGEQSSSSASSPRSFAPLTIIYERPLSSGESTGIANVDVDTSQPPDLMEDDYDCFSDITLDDITGAAGEGNGEMGEERETDAWIMLGEDGL